MKDKNENHPPKKVKSKDDSRRDGRDTVHKVPRHRTVPATHHVGGLELQERYEEDREKRESQDRVVLGHAAACPLIYRCCVMSLPPAGGGGSGDTATTSLTFLGQTESWGPRQAGSYWGVFLEEPCQEVLFSSCDRLGRQLNVIWKY